MKVGIYSNKNFISENIRLIDQITLKLNSCGIECRKVFDGKNLEGLNVLIVLGGDGTILTVAGDCARLGIKIMGINYGHMGFLAEFEQDKLDSAIDLICTQNFITEKRSMLNVEICGKSYLALNDLAIQRSTYGNKYSNTIQLSAEIDGSVVDNYLADGIIVCTPTGSTAYSLAAGGSVLTPDINAFALTPLCAHSLHSRPIVFSDSSVLKIIYKKNNTSVNVAIDGVIVGEFEDSLTATVTKSQYYVEFITTGQINFFDKLLSKLSKWSR
ncbi:MAG: NAD(+)/NADH kinase [Clostridia bacterium]|nr:NAD(+)/NADH kinase [Clostridia bacterium]